MVGSSVGLSPYTMCRSRQLWCLPSPPPSHQRSASHRNGAAALSSSLGWKHCNSTNQRAPYEYDVTQQQPRLLSSSLSRDQQCGRLHLHRTIIDTSTRTRLHGHHPHPRRPLPQNQHPQTIPHPPLLNNQRSHPPRHPHHRRRPRWPLHRPSHRHDVRPPRDRPRTRNARRPTRQNYRRFVRRGGNVGTAERAAACGVAVGCLFGEQGDVRGVGEGGGDGCEGG